ncbi:type II toxin-antitoxin system RelE/ParE family toxin [Eubacteriales bacterium OttesenSCG-928-A19]|nr:type II toxin-antitoxin system RelE/ParE family toxin [Eubacteriales bacterium OttesenSCG-928-A19]
MNHRIVRTDKYNDQLNEIIEYIASDSGDIDTALRYLDTVEAAVMRLRDFPEIVGSILLKSSSASLPDSARVAVCLILIT